MSKSVYRPDLDGRWDEDVPKGCHAFSAPAGEQPKWLRFGCRCDARITCAIALRPQKNAVGASWGWDGNREAPTVTPSINCEKGCGWHGWLKAGEFTP